MRPRFALVASLAVLSCLTPASGVGGAPPQGPRTVEIEMTEFKFRPAVIQLDAGRLVRLVFLNRGQIAHQFESTFLREVPLTIVNDTLRIEARGLDLIRLEPGTSARVEFLPRRRGRFAFACTIEGHREAGMRGTIEVR
jgi:uncharacterized cupredoxin-like copper-binding protein